MISVEVEKCLENLGKRLRDARLERNEPQEEFATRLGVSVPTLRKMEKGDPTVAIGRWVVALWVVGRIDDLDGILPPKDSLFERYEKETRAKQRRRATKRTSR